jgi:membrane protein YdbS with pleckstrin-like domain
MSKTKKGKDFKQFIKDENQKGRTFKKIMKAITGVSQSVMYAFVFLLIFVTVDVVVYVSFLPPVIVWAGILVAVALAASVLSSRVTSLLKRQQWKYASE